MTASTSAKLSVLFIGVGVPWRGGAGYLVRQSMMFKALARLDIDLQLAMFDFPADAPPPPFDARIVSIPVARELPETRWRSILNDFVVGDPMLIRKLDCREAREAVAQLKPERFDAVIGYRCDFTFTAGVLDHQNLILDIDDPEHIRRAEAAQWTDDGNAAWQRRLDLRRLKRFEINCARSAKACFVCQPRDAVPFQQAGIVPIIVPNCVEVGLTCPPRQVTSPKLVFLGNMQGSRPGPNVDAMLWLINDIWPRIRRAVPNAECLLAGPIRPEYRDQASGIEGMRVMGFVDDLQNLLQTASVSIAPIRFGTGTRIKILEAMAAGCPVVSTRKGCEGIEAADGMEIVIADDSQVFSDACVRMLKDAAWGGEIGRAGWQAVSDRYNRIKREQWLADVFHGLVRGQQFVRKPFA